MAEADRERWDVRYRERAVPEHPRTLWLDDVRPDLPRTGAALDVAAGTGPVACWMARRGLTALAVDVSPEGLALATQAASREGLTLQTRAIDLEQDPLPGGPFAMISCFHYRQPSLWEPLWQRVATGGVLVAEIATVTNLERHARPSRRWLVDRGQLQAELGGLAGARVDHAEEAWFDDRHLARVAVRRP